MTIFADGLKRIVQSRFKRVRSGRHSETLIAANCMAREPTYEPAADFWRALTSQ